MAWTIVKWGNFNSRIYVNYTFAANTTTRTWTLTANLRITIPSGYTFGPWNNTNAHSATLQANGMASLGEGDHDLTTSRQIASGAYDDNGTAPSVNVSWAFNVNSSWGGYENPYGEVELTGASIDPATPTAPTSCSASAGNGNYVAIGEPITVTYSGATGTITGYEMQRCINGGSWVAITSPDTLLYDIKSGSSVKYRVRAKNGSHASDWKESNTLYVSGKMKIKVNGSWVNGSPWIKVNGSWVRVKRVWKKVNGTWVQSK